MSERYVIKVCQRNEFRFEEWTLWTVINDSLDGESGRILFDFLSCYWFMSGIVCSGVSSKSSSYISELSVTSGGVLTALLPLDDETGCRESTGFNAPSYLLDDCTCANRLELGAESSASVRSVYCCNSSILVESVMSRYFYKFTSS